MVSESNLRICVIIPAYNESTVLGEVITDVTKAFAKTQYSASIIVIDDKSTDTTADVARTNGAIVIEHILNTGAGGATATGLSYAEQNGFNIAATMDADGQHAARDVVTGIDFMIKSTSDLLIGSRLIDSKGMSHVKILGNKGLSFVTLVLFGIRSTDSQSGLRIFSKKALDQLYWKASGYEFASEMLWRARQQKLEINEFPIEAIYTNYSKSKGQSNWNAINIIKSLLKQRLVEMFE